MNTNFFHAVLLATAGSYATTAAADQVTCESHDRGRKECPMDTRGEVRMVSQLSKAPCTEGVSWGYSKHAVWVEQGCRATFSSSADDSQRQREAGNPGPRNSSEGIPLMNATCGPGIEVHSDEGGPVFISGREASLKKFNDNYFEAKDAQTGTTISIVRNADQSMGMSYTGPHGDNGQCNVK